MALFGFGSIKKIKALEEENAALKKRNRELVDLCDEKDSYFSEMISDGLRHGSKLASKAMNDKKDFLNGR